MTPPDETYSVERMVESKKAMRSKLAQLPIGEKIRILEHLNERARLIRKSNPLRPGKKAL